MPMGLLCDTVAYMHGNILLLEQISVTCLQSYPQFREWRGSDVNKDLRYKAKDLKQAITQGQGQRIDMNKTENRPYVSVY